MPPARPTPLCPPGCVHDDLLTCKSFVDWFGVRARSHRRRLACTQAAQAEMLGLKPPLFSNVLAGTRRLPPEHLERVAEVLADDADEARLILRFYRFTYAPDHDREGAKLLWDGAKAVFEARHSPRGYHNHWCNAAIREMVGLGTPPDLQDVEAVRQRLGFPVPTDVVAAALSYLHGADTFRPGQLIAEAHRPVADVHQTLHRQTGELVKLAADLPRAQRQFSGYTDAVSLETLRALQIEVTAFMERVVAICNRPTTGPKEHVARVAVQLFPLTRVDPETVLFPEP